MTEKEVQKKFGLIIRELRKKHRLTQAKLAEAIGLQDETISNIERGLSSTRIKTAVSLARVFEIELKDLFDFPPETKTEKAKHNSQKELQEIISTCNEKTTTAIIKTARIMAELKG